MNVRWLLPIGVLTVAAVFGWRQQMVKSRLQDELARLQPAAEGAGVLQAQLVERRALSVDTNELAQLRRDHSELLRLRGEMGGWRERGRLTQENLEKKIRETQAQAVAAEREAGLVVARKKAADHSRQVLEEIGSQARQILDIRRLSGADLPRSWDDIARVLDQPWTPLPGTTVTPERLERFRSRYREWLKESTTEQNEFEFVSAPVGNHRLLLRERQPRARPDGGWVRAYAFQDDQVQEAISATGDFSEWEREAMRSGDGVK